MYVGIHSNAQTHTHTQTQAHTHTHTHTHTCMHERTMSCEKNVTVCTCFKTCICIGCTCLYACVYKCIYTCIHASMSIYIHTHTYTHIHTYMHAHIFEIHIKRSIHMQKWAFPACILESWNNGMSNPTMGFKKSKPTGKQLTCIIIHKHRKAYVKISCVPKKTTNRQEKHPRHRTLSRRMWRPSCAFLYPCSSNSAALFGRSGDVNPPWNWAHSVPVALRKEIFVCGCQFSCLEEIEMAGQDRAG